MQIIKIGIIKKVIYDNFISDIECKSCHKTNNIKLVITCKSFVIGNGLLSIPLWAWNKSGYTECSNCNAKEIIDLNQTNHADKILTTYNSNKIPIRFYLSSIFLGFVFLFISTMNFIGYVNNITSTPEEKLIGKWESADHVNTLYIFDIDQHALLFEDTVIIGHHIIINDSNLFSITINNCENKIFNLSYDNLKLKVTNDKFIEFSKLSATDKGENPYKLQYNQWKIRASQSESSVQIRNRILNFLTFLKIRYEWAIDNDIQRIVKEKYSPIILAANGIGIDDNSLLKWKPLFYSEKEWNQANEILIKSFPNKLNYDENETNIYKQNLLAIKAILNNFQLGYKYSK